jgi:hypothetical protein
LIYCLSPKVALANLLCLTVLVGMKTLFREHDICGPCSVNKLKVSSAGQVDEQK